MLVLCMVFSLIPATGITAGANTANFSTPVSLTSTSSTSDGKMYMLLEWNTDGAVLQTKDGKAINHEIYGFTDLDEEKWYYEAVIKATSAYTDDYVDLSKRSVRNNPDDYMAE